jgi:hypothetical protein
MSTKKTIIIVVDAAGTLSEGSLDGNIYLFDNKNPVGKGDTVLWNIMTLSPETFIQISKINANKAYMDVRRHVYADSDIVYWTGTIKQAFEKLSYQLRVKIGSCNMEFSWDLELTGN